MPNIWYITAMSGIEREGGEKNNFDPVDIMARFLSGRINREDLNENDSVVIDYYRGVMLDDPTFDSKVKQRLTELSSNTSEIERTNAIEILAQINLGRIKRADLSDEVRERVESLQKESGGNPDLEKQIIVRQNEISLMSSHKCEKKKHSVKKNVKKVDFYVQPSLLPSDEAVAFEPFNNDKSDLERKIDKVGKKVNSRRGGAWDKELKKEISHKKIEIRKRIGLPVARKGTGYENDRFYKFLVRRVVTWDVFSVVKDYCSATTGISEDLEGRIGEVRQIVSVLLSRDKALNQGEKFRYFDESLMAYQEKWGLDNTLQYNLKLQGRN